MTDNQAVSKTLGSYLNEETLQLLSSKGQTFIEQIGFDAIRQVILDVLVGKNLRDSTEFLTRRRIATLNLALVEIFLKGSQDSEEFINYLPQLAAQTLTAKKLSKSERWLAQWVLGLTDKSVQNVLRDNRQELNSYLNQYLTVCSEVATNFSKQGELNATFEVGESRVKFDWLKLLYLLNTVGTETLTIRGSEKSAYGKLFEKLILGSVLYIFGFKQVPVGQPGTQEKVFWLSSRADKRESDATLLYNVGRGVRFDIGFIGRGNSEISLDKVSRFEREAEFGNNRYNLSTIVIVDRIGKNSRVAALAQRINATIVQMSASYWPYRLAQVLQEKLGFNHEILNVAEDELAQFLKAKIQQVPIENLIGQISDFSAD